MLFTTLYSKQYRYIYFFWIAS